MHTESVRIDVSFFIHIREVLGLNRDCAVALWLRHYATNRIVAGSIPDKDIF
jgi:hypothetical protein